MVSRHAGRYRTNSRPHPAEPLDLVTPDQKGISRIRIYTVSVLVLIFGLFIIKIGAAYSRGGVVLFGGLGLAVIIAVRKVLGVTIRWAAEHGGSGAVPS